VGVHRATPRMRSASSERRHVSCSSLALALGRSCYVGRGRTVDAKVRLDRFVPPPFGRVRARDWRRFRLRRTHEGGGGRRRDRGPRRERRPADPAGGRWRGRRRLGDLRPGWPRWWRRPSEPRFRREGQSTGRGRRRSTVGRRGGWRWRQA
jgi:hypothetical protein